MKKIFLLLFVLVVTTGCSMFPTYYSKREIIKMVNQTYGSDYTLQNVEVNTGTNKTTGKYVKEYVYTFKNSEGHEFNMRTYTCKDVFLGNRTRYYVKCATSDYTNTLILMKEQKIKDALKNTSFELLFNDKDEIYKMVFVLDNQGQIPEAAKAIEEIDGIINLTYEDDPYYLVRDASVHVKFYEREYSPKVYSCDSIIHLSKNGKGKIVASEVEEKLKQQLDRCDKELSERKW